MKISKLLAAAIFVFSYPTCARAADGVALDLAASVAGALASSDALRAREALTASLEARRAQARAARLPGLAATASYQRSGEVEAGTISLPNGTATLPPALVDSTVLRLQLQQPLFTGGRITSGIAAAENAALSAAADTLASRAAVASAAERAYWSLYLAQEGEASAVDLLRAVERHRADAVRRLEQGAATRSEVLSWEQRKVQAELGAHGARSARERASASLALLLALSWDTPVTASPPPDAPADGGAGHGGSGSANRAGIASALLAARRDRADLAAADARAVAQDALLGQAKSSLFPSVFLTGSWSLANPNPKSFPQRSGFETLWDVGLAVSMDLGGLPANLSRVAEASENAKSARSQAAASAGNVAVEVVRAAYDVEDARFRMDASASSIALAEENLRVQKDRVAEGLAIQADLAEAEASLLAARFEGISSRVYWELARASLRDAVGGSAESVAGR